MTYHKLTRLDRKIVDLSESHREIERLKIRTERLFNEIMEIVDGQK